MCGSPFIRKLLRDDRGATAIEYGLIVALVVIAAITATSSLGGELTDTFNTANKKLDDANDSVEHLKD